MSDQAKDLMILSLPNTGSTWFAECVAKGYEGKYFYEYFNPLRNPDHEEMLARSFGCETVASYANIATPGSADIDTEIAKTWGQDGYHFTKEVFSPLKLATFAKRFHCVVFFRDESLVFPPSRLRIISFYEHAWWAIQSSPWFDVRLRANNAWERAREAFTVLRSRMAVDAGRLGVQVLHFEHLFGQRQDVEAVIKKAFGGLVDAEAVALEIEKTRRMPKADRVPT